MHRLAKPTDYVLIDVLGKSMYTIPWEIRLCPGNPADDPQEGASLYNEFVLAQANGEPSRTPEQQVDDIVDWTLATPGEAARNLALDLAAAYQGRYQFRIEDLEHWDLETKEFRTHLVFHSQDLRSLGASRVMALRNRSTTQSKEGN